MKEELIQESIREIQDCIESIRADISDQPENEFLKTLLSDAISLQNKLLEEVCPF